MKKAILIFSITLLLGACKNKDGQTTEQAQGVLSKQLAASPPVDCSFFAPMDSLTPQQQVKWLQLNQKAACDTIYDQCREDAHKITETEFNQAINDYWGANTPVLTDIKLEDIVGLSTQKEYDAFVSTNTAIGNRVQLSESTDFTDVPTCYSFPLFYSLQRLYKLQPETLLTFTIGTRNGKDAVIFMIKGTSNCYDMSTTPI